MSSFVDVANEINSSGALVKKRCIAGGKAEAGILQAKFATRLATNISSIIVLDTVGAGTLYDAIKESGLNEGNAQMLVAAADEQVLARSGVAKGTPANNTQVLVNPETWMPSSLASGLQDPRNNVNAKLQLVADFLSLCGCNHPHERTFNWWSSAVLASHFASGLPSYQNIFDKYSGFKQVMEASRKHWPFPNIHSYPKTPNQLPDAVFNHMYGDELPCPVTIPRLSVIANHHIPQRKNNTLLVGGTALSSAQLAPGTSLSSLSSTDSRSPSSKAAGRSEPQPSPSVQLGSRNSEPDWVRDLKEMLRPANKEAASESTAEDAEKEQVRALLTEVAAAEGQPQWAQALLGMLGSSASSGAPTAQATPAISLKTKSGIRLRMQEHVELRAPPKPDRSDHQAPPEPVAAAATTTSVAEYEAAAMQAILGKSKASASLRLQSERQRKNKMLR